MNKSENGFFSLSSYSFALGIDSTFGELTDLGGYKIQKDENNLFMTALRELKEESNDLLDFNKLISSLEEKTRLIKGSFCVYNEKNIILFIDFSSLKEKVGFKKNQLNYNFQKSKKRFKYNENSHVFWFHSNDLKKIIRTRTPFTRKKKPFHLSKIKCESYYHKLTHMPYFYEKVRILLFPHLDQIEKHIFKT